MPGNSPQAAFFFNGVGADGGGNFTLQGGIEPSTAILRFLLRYSFSQIGVLRLAYGNGSIQFRDCLLKRHAYTQMSPDGRWQEITIQDRRWAWADDFAVAYGEYNLYRDRTATTENKKTVRELASILFRSMGEDRFDVSALPNIQGPHVAWDATPAAPLLMQLAADYGCEVTLGADDVGRIVRRGFGKKPRNDSRAMDFTSGTEPPVIPKVLVCEGDEAWVQHDWHLVPAGPEVTGPNRGKLIPINDLSYAPSGAGVDSSEPWGREDPKVFARVDANYRQLAKQYIWKYYKIEGPIKLPVPPLAISDRTEKRLSTKFKKLRADYYTVKKGDEQRILPLRDHQLSIFGADGDRQDAIILGYFHTGGVADRNNADHTANANIDKRDRLIADVPVPAADAKLIFDGDYTVEWDYGYVVFDEPMYLANRNNNQAQNNYYRPAKIRLRTSAPLRDKDTMAPISPQFRQPTNFRGAVNRARLIQDADAFFEYGLKQKGSTKPESNKAVFEAYAKQRILQEMRRYQFAQGVSQPFKGFVFDYPPDGIIRTVQWDVAESGEGVTHVDFNMEKPENYLTLLELRNQRMVTFQQRVSAHQAKKKARRRRRDGP